MTGFNVATYNVRVDTDYDKNWAWDFRKHYVLDMIRFHEWDVFGVQEVLPKQIRDLSKLSHYGVIQAERDGTDTGEGLAIFYKKSLFEMCDNGYFWLSDTPELPSIHPSAAYRRIALWVTLRLKETGKVFLIINTHLDNESAEARFLGTRVLLEKLQNKIKNYPTIILGDFNAEPNEPLHELLMEDFVYPESNPEVAIYGPKGSFQNFDYFLPWNEMEQIDYIIYNEKGLVATKRGTLTDSCDRRYPSDHFPIVTYFEQTN